MPRKWGCWWEEDRVASRDGEKQRLWEAEMVRCRDAEREVDCRNLLDPVNTLKPEVAGSANVLI